MHAHTPTSQLFPPPVTPLDSPDDTPLLRHFRVLSGHSRQEAGGAPAFGTADADKVPRPHHVAGCLCRHLMGNHCVLADLLKDLWDPVVKSINVLGQICLYMSLSEMLILSSRI